MVQVHIYKEGGPQWNGSSALIPGGRGGPHW